MLDFFLQIYLNYANRAKKTDERQMKIFYCSLLQCFIQPFKKFVLPNQGIL